MNIKRLAAMAMLCIVPLTACASHTDKAAPEKSHTVTASPNSVETPKRSELAYLTVVTQEDLAAGESDSDLIDLGESICNAYKRDATTTQIMANLMETYSYTESGTVVASATAFLCPEMGDKV